jgi:hypothetical protein
LEVTIIQKVQVRNENNLSGVRYLPVTEFAHQLEIKTFGFLQALILNVFRQRCPRFVDVTKEFLLVAQERILRCFTNFGYLR